MKKIKVFILLCTVLMVLSIGVEATGNSNNNIVHYKEETVMEVATRELNRIIGSDSYEIDYRDEIVDAYDINKNLFANIIPFRQEGIISGYIIIGNSSESMLFYELSYDSEEYTSLIENLKGNKYTVYIPLDGFIIAQGNRYFIHDSSNALEEVSDKIDIKSLAMIYDRVNNSNNSYSMMNYVRFFEEFGIDKSKLSYTGLVREEYLLYDAWGQFVPIRVNYVGDPLTYVKYGGDQDWYELYNYDGTIGCGPIAGANIAYYLSKSRSGTYYDNLYTESYYLSDYMSVARTMFDYMDPGLLGTWKNDFINGFTDYADNVNVSIQFDTLRIDSYYTNLSDTAEFIMDSLEDNYPVAMLNGSISTFGNSDPNASYMTKHWVTATGFQLFSDGFGPVSYVTISTWADQRVWSFDVWYDIADSSLGVDSWLIVPQ